METQVVFINGIIAINRVQCIGHNNKVPWHEPADLAFFKRTTLNSTVVMGRRTFETTGPLVHRMNVVLTKDAQYAADQTAKFIRSKYVSNTFLSFYLQLPIVDLVLELEKLSNKMENGQVFICGGAQIYTLFQPYIQRWYISHMRNETYGNIKYTYFNSCKFTRRFFQSRFLVQHEKFMTVQYDEFCEYKG